MTKRRAEKDRDRLGAPIEEAIVDCYGPEKQVTGLQCTIDENVVFPFRAKVIGGTVEVLKIEKENCYRWDASRMVTPTTFRSTSYCTGTAREHVSPGRTTARGGWPGSLHGCRAPCRFWLAAYL